MEHGLGYLEAGLHAAKEAVGSVPETHNNALKNGIWRRVSALSKLMMDFESLEPEEGDEENANTQASRDVPFYTTYETAGQRQPLNPISTTATTRRGVGRKGKCGRKGNAERVLVIEDKDKRTKGADSHKDYMEAVKTVLKKVVENPHECNQSVRAAATQAQTTLLKYCNITIRVPRLDLNIDQDWHTCAHSPKDWRYSNPPSDQRAHRQRCALRPQQKAPCLSRRCHSMGDTPNSRDTIRAQL
jgi:hypothetical protein